MKIEKKSISGTLTILSILINGFKILSQVGKFILNFLISRKYKKKYKEAEDALKDKNVKRINDIFKG